MVICSALKILIIKLSEKPVETLNGKKDFLSKSLIERNEIAKELRDISKQATGQKKKTSWMLLLKKCLKQWKSLL